MAAPAWLWQIAVKKVATRVALLLVSYASVWGLEKYGVELNGDRLVIGIYAGLEWLRNWLKVGKGIKFIP